MIKVGLLKFTHQFRLKVRLKANFSFLFCLSLLNTTLYAAGPESIQNLNAKKPYSFTQLFVQSQQLVQKGYRKVEKFFSKGGTPHLSKQQEQLLKLLNQNLTSRNPRELAQIAPEDEDLIKRYLDDAIKTPKTIEPNRLNFPLSFEKSPDPAILHKLLDLLHSETIQSSTIELLDSSHFDKTDYVKSYRRNIRQTQDSGLSIILSSMPSEDMPNQLTFLKAQEILIGLLEVMEETTYDYPIRLTLLLHTKDLNTQQLPDRDSAHIFAGCIEPAGEFEKFLKFLIYARSLYNLSLNLVVPEHGTIIAIDFSPYPISLEENQYVTQLEQGEIDLDPSKQLAFYDILFSRKSSTTTSEPTAQYTLPIPHLYLRNLFQVDTSQGNDKDPHIDNDWSRTEEIEEAEFPNSPHEADSQTKLWIATQGYEDVQKKLKDTFNRQKQLIHDLYENFTTRSTRKLAEIETQDEELIKEFFEFFSQTPQSRNSERKLARVTRKGLNFPFSFKTNPSETIIKIILKLLTFGKIKSSTVELLDTQHFNQQAFIKEYLEHLRQKQEPGLSIILSSLPSKTDPNQLDFLEAQKTLTTLSEFKKFTNHFNIQVIIPLHSKEINNPAQLKIQKHLAMNPQNLFYGCIEPARELEQFLKFIIYIKSLGNFSFNLLIDKKGLIALDFSLSPLNKQEKQYTNQIERGEIDANDSTLSASQQRQFYDTLFMTDTFITPSKKSKKKKNPTVKKLYLRSLFQITHDQENRPIQAESKDQDQQQVYTSDQIERSIGLYWQLMFLKEASVNNQIKALEDQLNAQETHSELKNSIQAFFNWYKEDYKPKPYSSEQIEDFLYLYWQLMFLEEASVGRFMKDLKIQLDTQEADPELKDRIKTFLHWYKEDYQKNPDRHHKPIIR
jgi:hypothetical protein